MAQVGHTVDMELVLLIFFLVVGPLAVIYGTDSRIDEHRR